MFNCVVKLSHTQVVCQYCLQQFQHNACYCVLEVALVCFLNWRILLFWQLSLVYFSLVKLGDFSLVGSIYWYCLGETREPLKMVAFEVLRFRDDEVYGVKSLLGSYQKRVFHSRIDLQL